MIEVKQGVRYGSSGSSVKGPDGLTRAVLELHTSTTSCV